MNKLGQMNCTACRSDDPPVSEAEIAEMKTLIPEWSAIEVNGESRLQHIYRFNNFAQALEFTNRIGSLAELAGHHPALLTEWGRVTVTWWTHKIHGLHRNDFIMAAKSDQAYEELRELK